jgi:hypothetical protein
VFGRIEGHCLGVHAWILAKQTFGSDRGSTGVHERSSELCCTTRVMSSYISRGP